MNIQNLYKKGLVIFAIILFFGVVFIFWRDAYLAINKKTEVFLEPMQINEKGLQSILDSFEKKEKKLPL